MLTEDLKEDRGGKCCRDASVFRMQDAGGEGVVVVCVCGGGGGLY